MKIISLKDAAEEIENFIKRPFVIFAGSAVSIWKPSALPSGASVTKAVWEALLLQNLNPPELRLFRSVAAEFPFEHVFELCPSPTKAINFLIELYNSKEANPVHLAIAKLVNIRAACHVVTTNYDHCFEDAFGEYPSVPKIIADEEAALSAIGTDLTRCPLLFKVHGSATPGSKSLIYTLRDEGLLPKGKRTLLKNLLNKSSCLFIGYSGLDFDLCPLIATFDDVEILWIGREANPPTANARRLLEEKNGTYLQGDLREFLTKLSSSPCDAEISQYEISAADIKKNFTLDELQRWRVALINALGFPTQSLRSIDESRGGLPLDEQVGHFSRAVFYAGKYLNAAKGYVSLARHLSRGNDSRQASGVWLDASDSYRAGGFFVRAWWCLLRSKWVSPGIDRAKFELKKSLLLANTLEALAVARAPSPIMKRLKAMLQRSLNRCLKLAIEEGSLHDFQQVGFLSFKYEIELDATDAYLPTNPTDGYRHLGYYHAEIMTFNEEYHSKDFRALSPKQVAELNARIDTYVEHSLLTGQNSSIWKTLSIKKRLSEETNLEPFTQDHLINKHLGECQYTWLMRKLQTKRFRLRV